VPYDLYCLWPRYMHACEQLLPESCYLKLEWPYSIQLNFKALYHQNTRRPRKLGFYRLMQTDISRTGLYWRTLLGHFYGGISSMQNSHGLRGGLLVKRVGKVRGRVYHHLKIHCFQLAYQSLELHRCASHSASDHCARLEITFYLVLCLVRPQLQSIRRQGS